MENKLAVGKIVATHGLHGEVKVKSFSGEVEHFYTLTSVDIYKKNLPQILEIERVQAAGTMLLMKFKSIDTIDAAEDLKGAELWVERKKAAPLGENEFYFADLHGCAVEFNGKVRGRVINICTSSGNELLEIESAEGKTVFIPFLNVFFGEINTEEKRLELLEDWFFS